MAYLPDASEQFKKDLAEQFEYGEDWSSPDWNKKSSDIL
jgi:hypothetical protein